MTQSVPSFPYSASTLRNPRPNTVSLKVDDANFEESLSTDSANIYPGMILRKQSDSSVKRHPTVGRRDRFLVALEDSLWGKSLMHPFASGDLVPYREAMTGDHYLCLVNAGAAAIVEGDRLMSAGDGGLMLHSAVSLASPIADSTPVASSSAENIFNKTITIPANTLVAGDVIRIRALIAGIGVTSTPTLTTKLKLLSANLSPVTTVLLSTGAVSVIAADLVEVEFDLVVRTVGASGTIVGEGSFKAGTPGTAVETAVALASTALDTTVDQTVEVTAQWSASSSSNTCLLRELEVEPTNRVPFSPICEALEAVDNSLGTTMAYIRVVVM